MLRDMLRDRRRWTALTLIVLAMGVAWTFASHAPIAASLASPRQGSPAPDFTLDLLGGGEIKLSDLHSKPVLVNLWASWCPPCRAEMPSIQKVYQDYKDLGLVVLGVNTTNQDSEADAAAFVRQYGLSFPIPLDRDG